MLACFIEHLRSRCTYTSPQLGSLLLRTSRLGSASAVGTARIGIAAASASMTFESFIVIDDRGSICGIFELRRWVFDRSMAHRGAEATVLYTPSPDITRIGQAFRRARERSLKSNERLVRTTRSEYIFSRVANEDRYAGKTDQSKEGTSRNWSLDGAWRVEKGLVVCHTPTQ